MMLPVSAVRPPNDFSLDLDTDDDTKELISKGLITADLLTTPAPVCVRLCPDFTAATFAHGNCTTPAEIRRKFRKERKEDNVLAYFNLDGQIQEIQDGLLKTLGQEDWYVQYSKSCKAEFGSVERKGKGKIGHTDDPCSLKKSRKSVYKLTLGGNLPIEFRKPTIVALRVADDDCMRLGEPANRPKLDAPFNAEYVKQNQEYLGKAFADGWNSIHANETLDRREMKRVTNDDAEQVVDLICGSDSVFDEEMGDGGGDIDQEMGGLGSVFDEEMGDESGGFNQETGDNLDEEMDGGVSDSDEGKCAVGSGINKKKSSGLDEERGTLGGGSNEESGRLDRGLDDGRLGGGLDEERSSLGGSLEQERDSLGGGLEEERDSLGGSLEGERDSLGDNLEEERDSLGGNLEEERDSLGGSMEEEMGTEVDEVKSIGQFDDNSGGENGSSDKENEKGVGVNCDEEKGNGSDDEMVGDFDDDDFDFFADGTADDLFPR